MLEQSITQPIAVQNGPNSPNVGITTSNPHPTRPKLTKTATKRIGRVKSLWASSSFIPKCYRAARGHSDGGKERRQ
jgi:hypothetical protein